VFAQFAPPPLPYTPWFQPLGFAVAACLVLIGAVIVYLMPAEGPER
jgi:hypothetical protein